MKTFDKEYKLMTVKRVKESGKPVVEVARELDLSPNTLHDWMRKFGKRVKKPSLDEVLKDSRSGFYAYLARPVSDRQQKNEILLEKMKKIHQKSKATYGFRV